VSFFLPDEADELEDELLDDDEEEDTLPDSCYDMPLPSLLANGTLRPGFFC